jgi:polar amino acid transport system permease protein
LVFWHYLWPGTALADPLIRGGLISTILVSVIAQVMGVILGLFAALGKMSKAPPLRWLADAYIWYFRGTPLLVQMVLLYYGLGVTHIYDFPDIHLGFIVIAGAIQAGTLALGINEGAYMAEIVRAGIEVLPQAAKVIIPPLGNEFNNMMKTTTLMEVISAGELFFGFNQINARLFKPFELFIALSMYYLAMTTVWTLIQARIEAGLGERKGNVKTPGMFERLAGTKFGAH